MVEITEKERATILYTAVFLELEAEHQEFEQIAKDLLENRDTLIKLLIRLGSLPPGTTRVTTDSQPIPDSLRNELYGT